MLDAPSTAGNLCAGMDKPSPSQPVPPQSAKPAATAREARLTREAAALRANLLKRKQQSRERDKPKPE